MPSLSAVPRSPFVCSHPLQKTCITNLLNDAPAFGCSTTNEASCLCANATFSYGIRDCSNEACDDSANAASVIDYGVAYCSCKSKTPFAAPNSSSSGHNRN